MNESIKRLQETHRQSLRDMEFDERVHQAEQQLIDDIIAVRWDLRPLNSERDILGEYRLFKSSLKFVIWKAINS